MKSYNNIFFFNFWRNGDIHVSRNFVKIVCQVARTFNPDCGLYYVHKNPSELLEDTPYIKTVRFDNELVKRAFTVINTNMTSVSIDGNLYVNTWYGAGGMQHMKKYGITFDCLYDIFDTVLRDIFNVSLESIQPDPIQLFPSIDKHNVPDNIEMAKNLNGSLHKKVLICNGTAMSGHANNVDLIQPTINAFESRSDIEIYYTNALTKEYGYPLIDISSITTKIHNLLQIGYLARYFDLIIGRASGPSTFAINKEVIFDSNTQLLAFLRPEEQGILFSENEPEPLWLGNKFKQLYLLSHGKMSGYSERAIDRVIHQAILLL